MAAVSWVKISTWAPKLLRAAKTLNLQNVAEYAKPAVAGLGSKKGGKMGKMAQVVEKKIFPVETDPGKLVNNVCGSNIMKQGQDVALMPDSEYPDWLWSLRLGKPPPLEEMDQESLAYWRRLRKLNLRRQTKLMGLRRY
uniref:Large ribosomal subunit protein mL54 n=1 Tax=Megafenestra aurita TaxID=2291010 RepID=A0A4Y7NJN7_9CRUS|nr:EOG090X0KWJ [Megafenestra aurita]SVE92796.1 EOG090X0KWJ [Megafenestra aurita]